MLAPALAALALAAPPQLPVVVVPGLGVGDLERLASRGAVGLVVPDAGPTTSEARARASLERGEVVNSLRGKTPSGPVLVRSRAGPVPDGPAIVVGLPAGGEQRNDRRYPIAVLAPGWSGVLTSDSTRIPGIVSVADVASGRLRAEASDDPAAEARALDRRIRDNGTARLPSSVLAAVAIVALALVRPRAAVAAFATGALANLALGLLGISEPWAAIPAIAAGAASAWCLAGLSDRGLGLLLASTVGAYLVAMGVDASSVALSPLGPTQNARFFGISNLLETMLLVPALAGAWLLGRAFGWIGFAAVAVVSLVAIAGSRFGADGGGAIVLAVGLAALAAARSRAVAAAVAVVAVAGIALDALAGPATHVGASLRGGPRGMASDLADRVALSWERATAGWGVGLVTLAALAALALLVARAPRTPLTVAFALAIAVSLVVNDSPQDVAAGGLVGFLALARWTAVRGVRLSP